jgi:ABC-type dipeptide/oligopeptide/nickel transport system ATPase component
VAVLYRGHLVEFVPTAVVLASSVHPNTASLLAGVPVLLEEEALQKLSVETREFRQHGVFFVVSVGRPSVACYHPQRTEIHWSTEGDRESIARSNLLLAWPNPDSFAVL